MAYANFIPSVWNVGIDRELERLCVFEEDCNTNYEGEVKNRGESVTILGIGKPTIKRIAKAARNDDIDPPESIEDTSVIMYINQIAYFNYIVGDIDKAQATNGVMEALSGETSEGLANEIDKHIASMAVDSSVKQLYDAAPIIKAKETESDGEAYVLDAVDDGILYLQENHVPDTTEVVFTVSPRFFKVFKKAYTFEDTNNSNILKHGKIGMYGNVTVKRSNNVYRKDGVDYMMMRTKRAVAFAKPLTHTEAYRPERKFADAVKGFILFDAKVVRPKEIVTINVKYA